MSAYAVDMLALARHLESRGNYERAAECRRLISEYQRTRASVRPWPANRDERFEAAMDAERAAAEESRRIRYEAPPQGGAW